jgi:hypothetical protein
MAPAKYEEVARAAALTHLSALVGGTVVGVIHDGGDAHDGFFGLRVRINDDKTRTTSFLHVWIQRDPEGNGPGHLAIEPGAPR